MRFKSEILKQRSCLPHIRSREIVEGTETDTDILIAHAFALGLNKALSWVLKDIDTEEITDISKNILHPERHCLLGGIQLFKAEWEKSISSYERLKEEEEGVPGSFDYYYRMFKKEKMDDHQAQFLASLLSRKPAS